MGSQWVHEDQAMNDLDAPASAPWRAGMIEDFARSEFFDHTFQEGMDLVDETALYLDGPGRQDSKLCPATPRSPTRRRA